MTKKMRNLHRCTAGLLAAAAMLLCPVQVMAKSGLEQMNDLVKANPYNCEVVVYSLDYGELYAYKKNIMMEGASLIKLPYAYFVCKQLSNGVRSLDETITYTSSWYHGGSGVIRTYGYGKQYTIRQLLDYAMRYSDNVAYDMLVYLFGTEGFNQMVKEWGYSIALGTPSPRFPVLNADFMNTSMRKMYACRNDGECWEVTWKALCESVDTYIRPTLGEEVAVKYGNISSVYHETCLVQNGDSPYVLVVFSGAVSMKPKVSFFQDAAKISKTIIAEYEAEHPPVPGDVTWNGVINAVDAAEVLIESAAIGSGSSSTFSQRTRTAADFNGDGVVDTVDAAAILSYSAGMGAYQAAEEPIS